jgi:hypothetical protein
MPLSVICCLFTASKCLTRTDVKEKPDRERHCAALPDNVAPQIDEPLMFRRIDEPTMTSRIDSRVPGV